MYIIIFLILSETALFYRSGLRWWFSSKEPHLSMEKMWFQSLGQEDPLAKEISTHSSIFAWEVPWTEESGGLQSLSCKRVGHNWVTKQQSAFHFFLFLIIFHCMDISHFIYPFHQVMRHFWIISTLWLLRIMLLSTSV